MFWLTTLFAFRRICIESPAAHYRLFTLAGRALWEAKPAYGSDHGTNIGLWLYSPSCGMFFFAPFSFLPNPIGQFLYMALSIALFAWGAHALLRVVLPKKGQIAMRESFYVLCAAPMLSAIVTTKLEIAMTGILMLAAAALIEKRALVWSGLGMALIANWKLQPAPTILLWLVVLWLSRAGELKRFGAGLAGGLILTWVLPHLFLPSLYISHEEAVWASTLSTFTRTSVYNFENVFTFFKFAFGPETPWWLIQALSALTGLAAAVCVWSRPGILLASALGAAFTMAFSPLGQNSALILTAPLLIWISLRTFERLHCVREQVLFLLAVAFALIVPYSDLVPLPEREWMHALSVKQMLLLAATCFVLYLELRGRSVASTRRTV